MQTGELLRNRLLPALPELARCGSSAELEAHPLYRSLLADVAAVLETPDIDDFRREQAPARARYRILAWNIERGAQLDGQIEALRSHAYLKTCDVLLLTETDAGMARSGNRAVARAIAQELGMAYAFAPCYLNLTKGSGVEHEIEGVNELGLHGNAVLSRYPIAQVRRIPLPNGIDKMASREKRLGCQTAVVAEIDFPNFAATAVSIHLDAQSSQRHRCQQMAQILNRLETDRPAILGGDWNTSTYNSSRALHAILGFWLRVMMGVDHVIRNHYLHPDRLFERDLFELLVDRGFDYQSANRLGEHTVCYDIHEPRANKSLADWVPAWCFPFIRWSLRNHGGRCPLKLDWFATRGLKCADPVVIHDLELSDHDAICVDVAV